MRKNIRLASLDDTKALAARLASSVPNGVLILLHGELGAGKTAFVKAFAFHMGVRDEVVSPTFVLEGQYRVGPTLVCHWDLYRLNQSSDELLAEILEERQRGAVIFVEWPERIPSLETHADLRLTFLHTEDLDARECIIDVADDAHASLLQFVQNSSEC